MNKKFSSRVIALLSTAAASLAFASAASAATINVPCAGGACTTAGITTAIAAANSGDTISLAAGTYTGQFTVNKPLTISGAGKATTIIKSPPHGTQVSTFSRDDGSGNFAHYPIVTVTSGPSTVQNLTVDGSASGSDSGCAPQLDGIAVLDAAVSITNTGIDHIRLLPQASLGGCQSGRGIYARNTDGTPRTINVTNSTVTDYQKNGIDLRGAGLTVNVAGNTVTDTPDPAIASNGMVVGSGAGGSITGNTVSGNQCNLPNVCDSGLFDTAAGGIIVFDNTNLTISGNTLSNNDYGIYASSGTSGTTTINGNTLSNNRWQGLFLDQGTTNAANNTIAGSETGIVVISYAGNTAPTNVTLGANTITGANTKILSYDDDPNDAFEPTITQATGGGSSGTTNTVTVVSAASGPAGSKVTLGKPKVKGKKAKVRVTCPASNGTCFGSLVIKRGGKTYGQATFKIGGGASTDVTVALGKAGKKKVGVKVTATTRSATGLDATSTLSAKLKVG